jgi:hypothetical protein
MGENLLRTLSERWPFITLCVYAGNEYLGIIQNRDNAITTLYDFGSILSDEEKNQFIDLANTWWWESNRSIPINIFLKAEWEQFRPYLRTFSNRDLQILHGPVCSLTDISQKKSKRRSITLVRKLD